MAKDLNSGVYAAMQTGQPYSSYIKTIVGKIYVTILNPFYGEPVGKIIEGDPRGKNKESCIIDTWSEKEDVFFRRMNRAHFEKGNIIPYVRKAEEINDEFVNDITDEMIDTLLGSRFLVLQNAVNKFTSPPPVFRILNRARELEKSEKIIKFLEGKLSELQLKEYGSVEE